MQIFSQFSKASYEVIRVNKVHRATIESSEKRTAVLGGLRATIPSRLPEQDYPSIFKLQMAHFLDTLASILSAVIAALVLVLTQVGEESRCQVK